MNTFYIYLHHTQCVRRIIFLIFCIFLRKNLLVSEKSCNFAFVKLRERVSHPDTMYWKSFL